MAEAHTETPRSVEFEVIRLARLAVVARTIGIACLIVEHGIIASGEVVPCWRVNIQSDTERRLFCRTEYQTRLNVETSTCNLTLVVHCYVADRFVAVNKIL